MRRPHIVTNISAATGIEHEMTMTLDALDLEAWREGANIQDVLGYLSADEREFIKTGITPEEWAELFGEED